MVKTVAVSVCLCLCFILNFSYSCSAGQEQTIIKKVLNEIQDFGFDAQKISPAFVIRDGKKFVGRVNISAKKDGVISNQYFAIIFGKKGGHYSIFYAIREVNVSEGVMRNILSQI